MDHKTEVIPSLNLETSQLLRLTRQQTNHDERWIHCEDCVPKPLLFD